MTFGPRYSLLAGALLAPFAYAAYFAFPFGDDFARSVLAHGLFDVVGGLHDMVWNWRHWSGRYTHHFLTVFLGDAVLTRTGYGTLCLSVLALYGVALHGIVGTIAPQSRRADRLFIALAGLAAIAGGHEALNITYYVATDALGIGVGNALALAFVWTLCRLWHLPALRRRDVAFAAATGILAIGSYEHAALAACTAAAAAAWLAHRAGHPHRRAFHLAAGIALAFLLVSFLAPGNFSRQSIRDVGEARIAAQLLAAGSDWLAVAPGALATHFALYAAFLGLAVSPKPRAGLSPAPVSRLATTGVAAFLAGSAAIVLVHALSDLRATDLPKLPASIHLLLGIPLGFLALACGAGLRARLARLPAWGPALALLAACAASANTAATLHSIAAGELDAYAAVMQRRIAVFGASAGGDAPIAPLAACPFPSCAADPLPRAAAAWPAPHVARLYGVRATAGVPPSPSAAYAAALGATAPAWTTGGGAGFLCAEVEPGPNATYRDLWIFVRVPAGTPPPEVGVWARLPGFAADVARRARLAPVAVPGAEGIYAAPLGIPPSLRPEALVARAEGSTAVRVPVARP